MSLAKNDLPKWLRWLDSCPSTNTWASSHSASLKHGDVVFTQKQTAGRGQRGHTWYSPPGVLTASFVLDQIPVVQLPKFSLAAGLAAIYAVEDLLPGWQGMLRLKWPNDVLLDGHKLAGILCESRVKGLSSRVVVGIGLNRCVDFAQSGLDTSSIGYAISLHQVSSVVPDELPLLERLRHYLLQTAALLGSEKTYHKQTGISALLPALRCRDALLGRPITLDLGGEQVSGQGAGIDEFGCLLLRLPDGELSAFASGHVLWQQLA